MSEIKRGEKAIKAVNTFAGNKKAKLKSYANGCAKAFSEFKKGMHKENQIITGFVIPAAVVFGVVCARAAGADLSPVAENVAKGLTFAGLGAGFDGFVSAMYDKKRSLVQKALTPKKTAKEIGASAQKMVNKMKKSR